MPVYRFIPIALALILGGCGSIGAIGPFGRNNAPTAQTAGGLPPPPANQNLASAPPGGAVISEPLPPATGGTDTTGGGTQVAAAEPPPAAPASTGTIGRTDLLGGWTIASSGDSCQLFMTLTSWTGGYRASTRGCSSDTLKSISAWNLEGRQVILAGQGGSPIARLQSAGGNRFDGAINGGGSVSFYR